MKITENADFIVELEHLINKCGIDNACNTPDHILVDFVVRALEAYQITKERYEDWRKKDIDFVEDLHAVKITQENYERLRETNKLKSGQIYIIVENQEEENYIEI
jgi:hypothetical protein